VAVVGDGPFDARTAAWVEATEAGLRLARDLCGTEPERMAPPKFAAHVQQAFRGLPVKVTVQKDAKKLEKDYPLLMAVARASMGVARHRPCVVRLEYTPKGKIERTLLLAGKGLTYDTGGADLKTGGHMAGMSRDKGGAAAVAGLVLAAAKLKGPACKPDRRTRRRAQQHRQRRLRQRRDHHEPRRLPRAHRQHRRRGPPRAGRPAVAPAPRRRQGQEPAAVLVATLTGHAGRASGPLQHRARQRPCAHARHAAESLMRLGDVLGDPFEVSRLRREDFDFVQPRSKADDVLSCNNAPSSATAARPPVPDGVPVPRQRPRRHGNDSAVPLPFTHIDIGGSGCEGGDWQHGRPTGRPLVAMLAALCGAPPP
jgi:leucyl aminopeptidase